MIEGGGCLGPVDSVQKGSKHRKGLSPCPSPFAPYLLYLFLIRVGVFLPLSLCFCFYFILVFDRYFPFPLCFLYLYIWGPYFPLVSLVSKVQRTPGGGGKAEEAGAQSLLRSETGRQRRAAGRSAR